MIEELLEKLLTTIQHCGASDGWNGFSILLGIIGSIMTLYVSLKTKNITKILKHNDAVRKYNEERILYKQQLKGYAEGITQDHLCSPQFRNMVLSAVEEYRSKYGYMLTITEKIRLFHLVHLLQKDVNALDWNRISVKLSILAAHLDKPEENIYA